MANYISQAPLWATMLFIASFLYSILFITKPAKQAALNSGITISKSRNIQIGIFVFYLFWLIYTSVLALKGIFQINSLPPRVVVFTVIPLSIILFAYIGNTPLFKKLLRSATLESLIAIHVFRLVGVFFIILYFYHLLPAGLAFSAGLGDIITALFALPVSKWVANRKPWARAAVYAWSIFGVMDIVIILIRIGIIASRTIATGESGGIAEMTIFPFVWFPAFAPATILFMHTIIFRKLRQLKQAE